MLLAATIRLNGQKCSNFFPLDLPIRQQLEEVVNMKVGEGSENYDVNGGDRKRSRVEGANGGRSHQFWHAFRGQS